MADRAVKARIGVARTLLDQQVGQPTHAAVSQIQARAIVDLLRERLAPDACAEVCQLGGAIPVWLVVWKNSGL